MRYLMSTSYTPSHCHPFYVYHILTFAQSARDLFLRPRVPLQRRLLPAPAPQQASQLLHPRRRPRPLNLGGRGSVESTIFHPWANGDLLKDTAIYCAAEKFGLEELKRLALRKQGLQSGIPVEVILRSARFAYENTPDTDNRLRAHYLALIIRSRKIFKRSGTMQMEMEIGAADCFSICLWRCVSMWMMWWRLLTSRLPRPSNQPHEDIIQTNISKGENGARLNQHTKGKLSVLFRYTKRISPEEKPASLAFTPYKHRSLTPLLAK